MAFNTPSDLQYVKTHEWLRQEGDLLVVGITDYAQDALGDVVFVELPEAGTSYKQGDVFGVVESVKAASDLFMPAGGEVVEVNQAVIDAPELLNSDPYGDGWMIKLRPTGGDAEPTLDAAAYTAFVDSIAH